MKNFKKKKICIVSSTRADFGILSELIQNLQSNKLFKTYLFVTGSHLEKKYGLTINEIKSNRIKIFAKIKFLSKKNKPINILNSSNAVIKKFSLKLKKLSPNLIILLGDRYEIFCIAYCAYILGIPIAHFYGGEVTQNSLDDNLRHAVTKLSNFHFVSSKIYLKRVLQLGESKKNIFNIGSLSLDQINKRKFLKKKTIEKKLKIKLSEKLVICTFHPETNNSGMISSQISCLLSALKKIKKTTIIFTIPNDDIGTDFIIKKIKNFCRKKNNSFYFKSLGKFLYFSCVKLANLVVGNSSSGIIEAPSLGTYTLNLGKRQNGRVKSQSVYESDFKKDKIYKLVNKLINKKKNKFKNPYYKKNSLAKTIKIINKLDLNNINQKGFIDL